MILTMIDAWPEFLQYLVINDIAPFDAIISLSKTCKALNLWVFSSFKAYQILYAYNLLEDMSIFKIQLNEFERRLFHKIYKLCLRKITMNFASVHGLIPILDWYLEEYKQTGFLPYYTDNAIEMAIINQQVDVLKWWISSGLELKCSSNLFDEILFTNNVEFIDWCCTLYHKNLIQIKHFPYELVERACRVGNLFVINWLYKNSFISDNIQTSFIYTSSAIDIAADNNYLHIIKWFYNHSRLEWFQTLDDPNEQWIKQYIEKTGDYPIIEFKYSTNAIDNASRLGNIEILNWFVAHFPQLNNPAKNKFESYYTNKILQVYDHNIFYDVFTWWLNSGFEIKFTDRIIALIYNHDSDHNKALSRFIQFADEWFQKPLLENNRKKMMDIYNIIKKIKTIV